MTFKEIQDAVLADTFDESKRASVKNWINGKYTELCDLDDWTFMRAVANVSVSVNSATVSGVPADFAVANALLDQYGCPLEKMGNVEEFVRRYMDSTTSSPAQPEAFCVFGSPATFDGGSFGDGDFGGGEGLIAVGPTSNVASSTFRLLYERAAPTLVIDADVPILPAGYHLAVVAGARAFGCRLSGMTAEAEEADAEFRSAVDALRRKYRRAINNRSPQVSAYRPH